jgi:hypothetical protein
MLMLTGLAFLLLSARGRALWRDRGLWVALAISFAGLIPILLFNAQHDWVALGFQLVERNPWHFHADGLMQPIEQAIISTPLFYAAMLWVLWRCLQRVGQGGPWDLLAICAAVPVIAWFVLGCFADDTRLRVHWPLPGYLPLLLALPALLAERSVEIGDSRVRRAFPVAAFALLALGCLATLGWFALAAVPGGASALARFKAFPEHWVGWNEVAARTQSLLAEPRYRDATLVADNFMLAAELDFALDASRPVYTLDHPINAKHGRVPQLALWRRDETALRGLGPRPLLLVIEPTARRERERAAWLETVCARVADPRLTDTLELYAGRKRYLFVNADGLVDAHAGRDESTATDCTALR